MTYDDLKLLVLGIPDDKILWNKTTAYRVTSWSSVDEDMEKEFSVFCEPCIGASEYQATEVSKENCHEFECDPAKLSGEIQAVYFMLLKDIEVIRTNLGRV